MRSQPAHHPRGVYLHEPAAQTINVARETVEKVFRERQIDAKTNHYLQGKVEKRINLNSAVEGWFWRG